MMCYRLLLTPCMQFTNVRKTKLRHNLTRIQNNFPLDKSGQTWEKEREEYIKLCAYDIIHCEWIKSEQVKRNLNIALD